MFYAPKHSAPKASPVRRRIAGIALVGAATVAGGLATASTAEAAPAVWDRVAACESGGNWAINTGNGFYGGLQFSASTWRAFGGGAYAATANRATKAQQILVAQRVLKTQGPGAWPVCSRRAGLSRANGGAAGAVTATTPPVRASRSVVRAPIRSTAGKLSVDGALGPKTTAAIQRWIGAPADGSLSRTDIQKLQRKVGAAADGVIGRQTIRSLQSMIGAARNGASYLDRATVRSLQIYLNRVL